MRKVLLTLTAAIMMVGLNAQSIGWAQLASINAADGLDWNDPTVGISVSDGFDLVLSYDIAGDEFDFAVRKAMGFGFVQVGGFGDDMTIAFGKQFGALMDGLNFEPTMTWADDAMTMSMGVSVSF